MNPACTHALPDSEAPALVLVVYLQDVQKCVDVGARWRPGTHSEPSRTCSATCVRGGMQGSCRTSSSGSKRSSSTSAGSPGFEAIVSARSFASENEHDRRWDVERHTWRRERAGHHGRREEAAAAKCFLIEKKWDELGPFRHSRHSSSHNDNDSNDRQDDPAPKHDDCLALAVGLP